MIRIELSGIGKRFGRQWVLREFNDVLNGGETIGIKGRNGSGKSTLLRILCGQLTPSRGAIAFHVNEREIGPDQRYRHVSWTGPYIEIIEELTIVEFLDFHFKFKPLQPGIFLTDVPAMLGLADVRNRRLTDCSSGMRQRVLLGSALYADTPLLLLDEPTITLDTDAMQWFHRQLREHRGNRLVVIASNDEQDLSGCNRIITLRSAANSGI